MDFYEKPSPFDCLLHHGIKGQKWGVRRTPEELAKVRTEPVETGEESAIMERAIFRGHSATPKRGRPDSIADHISDDGTVDVRTFYGEDGMKEHDIHTTDHGHPKQHPYGEHGEHVEIYEWNEDGSLRSITRRELTDEERKENGDIL